MITNRSSIGLKPNNTGYDTNHDHQRTTIKSAILALHTNFCFDKMVLSLSQRKIVHGRMAIVAQWFATLQVTS